MIKSTESLKLIKSNQVSKIKRNKKLCSQSKFYWASFFYSVVYISREQTQNHLFCFKLPIKKTKRKREKRTTGIRKKRKNKTCVLTPYQDMLVSLTFKYIKMGYVLTPYQDVLDCSALQDIT